MTRRTQAELAQQVRLLLEENEYLRGQLALGNGLIRDLISARKTVVATVQRLDEFITEPDEAP